MPTPEEAPRAEIDRQLEMAGWVVQDIAALNRFAGRGVAVRDFRLAEGHGRADYMLYVDGKAVGVVEAKPAGTTLTGVEPQTEHYSRGLTALRPGAVTNELLGIQSPWNRLRLVEDLNQFIV